MVVPFGRCYYQQDPGTPNPATEITEVTLRKSNPEPDISAKTGAVGFAHPSEREFARILDFYGVRWEYEPRSFLLNSEEGRVTEMFTPDFYLVEMDLYVELTTMRQSLVTQKTVSFAD